jgi:hypothetical protein
VADPGAVYCYPKKGFGTRKWIELVGVLHRLGYGRLRLACSWENAGPAPVWFGDIAPVTYFRADHGAILARHPFPEKVAAAWRNILPNDAPMFSSRRCGSMFPNHPWAGFGLEPVEKAAERWLAVFPALAAEGLGDDSAYVAWYARMLEATAPTGLIAASRFWEPSPGFMYVSCGPAGVDRFDLPPPGAGGISAGPSRPAPPVSRTGPPTAAGELVGSVQDRFPPPASRAEPSMPEHVRCPLNADDLQAFLRLMTDEAAGAE